MMSLLAVLVGVLIIGLIGLILFVLTEFPEVIVLILAGLLMLGFAWVIGMEILLSFGVEL